MNPMDRDAPLRDADFDTEPKAGALCKGRRGRPLLMLSLRWKALFALSLLLLGVNGSLAFLAYVQAARQFDLQQRDLRGRQDFQLRAMVKERVQEMSKLASLVPLMGPNPPVADVREQTARALETNGSMVEVEWDIRSVHLLDTDGQRTLSWPVPDDPLPDALLGQIAATADRQTDLLVCGDSCSQFLAAPLLWEGRSSGTLVLQRSLADSLQAFRDLTGAEVAITPQQVAGRVPDYFPAMTRPKFVRPILDAAGGRLANWSSGDAPILVNDGAAWFEIFRLSALAPGVDALIVNNVTAQRRAIRVAMRDSVAIGILGLLVSVLVLFGILNRPLSRLRRIAAVLPLLADNRYGELRQRLPPPRRGLWPCDEMDLMSETVVNLTDRMESLQRDRELAETRLVWLADHDPLTQLYNRRRFNEDFARLLDQAIRFQHQGALLFFDLDQFKDVNDIGGHQVGDALLQRVADELRALTRPSDVLARLGGDEFAWVLPEATSDEALAIAERTQAAIRSIVLDARGRRHQVSASIGIVLFPDQGRELNQVMADADLAMYQAKEKGRGRSHLFADADQARERADARVLWREQISKALAQDRFELHFQPIVEIASGRIVHYEALLRMRDEGNKLIYPDRFIPVAEKTGQIQSIDHWVLYRALELMSASPQLSLAVNLSANAMSDPSLLPDIARLLRHYGVEPKRLAFEITETAAVNSVLQATRLMRGIQNLGCRFALDDFGSGYASYAYLRQLPVDDVKVDGAFVRNLANSREDRIFVKAITDMAHGMGKGVIAEYVEDGAILAVLAELGVDYAQGYYLGRPKPLPVPPSLGHPSGLPRWQGL